MHPDIATDVIDKIATSLPQQCARVRAMFYPQAHPLMAIIVPSSESAAARRSVGYLSAALSFEANAASELSKMLIVISTSVPPSSRAAKLSSCRLSR
jgi:hypothetical protein